MKEKKIVIPDSERLRILQLTDMQIIDASQLRRPDRLSERELERWAPTMVEKNCFSHIRDIVTQTRPHLILITGDIVYGEFDDNGSMLKKFSDFMDSLSIPWAPTFGNHDKESKIGLDAVCQIFKSSKHCLFDNETTAHEDGDSNYAIKVYQKDRLVEMVYLLDTKGCTRATEQTLRRAAAITESQCQFLESRALAAREEAGRTVPAIAAYHIPTKEFFDAFEEKGYPVSEGLVIGVTVPACEGDFGAFYERDTKYAESPESFAERLHKCGVTGVFAGHDHLVNTSVVWRDIRWTFGLKCGTYDYHQNGSLGGTLIEIDDGKTTVRHIPTLVGY